MKMTNYTETLSCLNETLQFMEAQVRPNCYCHQLPLISNLHFSINTCNSFVPGSMTPLTFISIAVSISNTNLKKTLLLPLCAAAAAGVRVSRGTVDRILHVHAASFIIFL